MKKITQGFFGGEYELNVDRRKKSTCLLFSGQGTAKPQMYRRTFEQSEILKEFFYC